MNSILRTLPLLAILAAPVHAQSLGKQDAQFLRQMGEADLAEVEAGKLAAQKASSAEVKQFAQHMIEEHSKGMKEGEGLAKAKGQQPPASPDKKHQAAMKKLESMSGDAFDKAYMKEMVQGHQEVLKMLQTAAKSAQDPDIKAAAQKKIPTVQKHLDMAKTTVASLDGGKQPSASGSSSRKESK
ncbi:MAG: putative rane protein [Betaproteobacteria bacterium]|jgi:putative membrane protein|nr:putative rane protein [Betaproteobacteria bacterium]